MLLLHVGTATNSHIQSKLFELKLHLFNNTAS